MTGGIRSQDAGSPLELFFDLVFIFAVSELSHHLLNQLSWRRATETLVLLIAVEAGPLWSRSWSSRPAVRS